MNCSRLFAALMVTLSLTACGTPDPRASAAASDDKIYTTGSRIPVRQGGGSAAVRSIDNKQDVDESMQNRSIYVPGKSGPTQ